MTELRQRFERYLSLHRESIRRDLAVDTSKPEAAPVENRTCPHCEQGTMITILIIDGYGNVIVDETELADPVAVMDTT